MPETVSAPEAQVAEGAQPQEGTTPAQVAEPTLDAGSLQRELAEARREAAKYRTDLRKVTDAQLSESERLQRRVTELEAERAESAARDRSGRNSGLAALEAAAKLGFRDPDLAVRLVDPASRRVPRRRHAEGRRAAARGRPHPFPVPRPPGCQRRLRRRRPRLRAVGHRHEPPHPPRRRAHLRRHRHARRLPHRPQRRRGPHPRGRQPLHHPRIARGVGGPDQLPPRHDVPGTAAPARPLRCCPWPTGWTGTRA